MTNIPDTLVQDARDLLQYETTDLVTRELQHLGWAQINQATRTLTIGRNTQAQTIIAASPQGLAITDPGTLDLSLLITRSSHRIAPFWKARQAIWNTAEQRCWQHLNITLRGGKPLFHNLAPDPPVIRKQRMVEKAVHSAVRNILARTGQGYVRNPERLGRHLIRTLLGAGPVSRTLRYAGYHATLRTHNRIVQDLEAISAAHHEDPNATILHFAQKPETWDQRLTRGQILQSARSAFIQDCRTHAPGQDPEELWQAFRETNPHTFRKFPPYDGAHILILSAAQESGTIPTCSAIQALLRERPALENLPRQAVNTFIQESSRRALRPRTSTQAQLAWDLRVIGAEIATRRDNPRHPDIIPSLRRACQTTHSWQDIVQAVLEASPREEWPERPGTRTGRAARGGTPKTGPAEKRTTQTPTVRAILQSGEGQRLLHGMQERITLNQQPGRQALIQDNRTGKVLIGISRDTDGTLTLRGSLRGTPNPVLPHPLRDLPTDPAWSCRGELNLQMVQEARKIVTRHPLWVQAGFVRPPTPGHLKTAMLELSGHRNPEQLLSARFIQAVRQLVDPGTWEMTQELFPDTTIGQYNSVQASREPIRQLLIHNPGAIAWAAHHYMMRIQHPGQTVALVRSHLALGGILGPAWKHSAKLNPRTMRAVCETQDPTRLLQAIAASRSQPVPECIPAINSMILLDHGWRHAGSRLLDPLLQLACQQAQEVAHDPQAVQEFRDQLTSIRDYCHHLAQDRQPLWTRSWKRALRLAIQWHRQTTQEARVRQWENIMRSRESGPLRWESCLTGPVRIDGMTFTPLCSEEELRDESARMNHCVIHYGEQCHAGHSRIFSVQKDAKPLATLEINPGPGGTWQTAQLRGPHNHPVAQEVQNAAQHLAQLYGKAGAGPL